MSAFPSSLDVDPRSRVRPASGLRTYLTAGGQVRGRKAYAATVYDLDLFFDRLNDSEITTLFAHYDADPDGDHTVSVRGVTYAVKYQEEPAPVAYDGVLVSYRVRFLGPKQ